MAGNKTASAKYIIEFHQKGLNKIESELAGFSTNVQNLIEKATKFNLPLDSLLAKKKEEIRALAGEFEKVKEAFLNEAASGEMPDSRLNQYFKEFEKLSVRAAKVKADIISVEQAIKYSASGMGETFEKNIRALEKFGIATASMKKAKEAAKDLQATFAQPGGLEKVRALNAALEKEYRWLDTLAKAEKDLENIRASSEAKAAARSKISATKVAVASDTISAREKDAAVARIKALQTELNKAAALEDKLIQKVSLMAKEYGLAGAKVRELGNDIQRALEHSLKTGKLDPLKEMEKALQRVDKELRKTTSEFSRMFNSAMNDAEKFTKFLEGSSLRENAAVKGALEKLYSPALDKLTSGKKLSLGEIGEIKELFSVLSKIGPKMDELYQKSNKFIAGIHSLGLANDDVEKLKTQLVSMVEVAAKTGNITPLKNFTESLKVMEKQIGSATEKVKTLKGMKLEIPAPTPEQIAQWEKEVSAAKRLDSALLKLERRYAEQVGSLQRMIEAKSRWASPEDIKRAEKELLNFQNKLKGIQALQTTLRSQMASGTFDMRWIASANRGVDALNHKLEDMKVRAKEAKAGISKLDPTKWMVNVAKRAVAYAGLYMGIYQVINALRDGIGMMVEFDRATRTIAAVFDISAQSAKHLEDRLIGLGKAWGGSIKDINEAALALGRAGISSEKLVNATEVVMKMAKLTGDSIQVSASALITYQQVFGDTGKSLQEFGDQLAYVANQSRLSTQDIGTYSNYALAAAKASGFTMEAVNAMATAFSNAGVNASTIGTQIRRFSSLLKDNSTATREFFMKMGLSQKQFAIEMAKGGRLADKALEQLVVRLSQVSDQDFREVIAGMDILAAQSITLLRNNASEFLRHFHNLQAGVQGELDKADQIAQSHEAIWQKLTLTMGEAFSKIVENVMPAVTSGLKEITKGLEWVAQNADKVGVAFKTMVAAFTAASAITLGKFLGIGKAIDGVLKIAGTARLVIKGIFAGEAISAAVAFAGVLSKIKGLFAGLSLGRFLFGPWGLAISAVATGAYALYEALSDDKKEMEGLKGSAKRTFSSVVKDIEAVSKKIREQREELVELKMQAEGTSGTELEGLREKIALKVKDIEVSKKQLRALEKYKKSVERMMRLEEINEKLKEYNIIIKTSLDDTEILDKYNKLKARLQQEKFQIELEIKKDKLKSRVSSISKTIEALKNKIEELKGKGLASDHPAIVALTKRIKELEQQLDVTIEKEHELLNPKIDSDFKAFDIAQKKIIDMLQNMGSNIINMKKVGVDTSGWDAQFFALGENIMQKFREGAAKQMASSMDFLIQQVKTGFGEEKAQEIAQMFTPIKQALIEALKIEDPTKLGAALRDVYLQIQSLLINDESFKKLKTLGIDVNIEGMLEQFNALIAQVSRVQSSLVKVQSRANAALKNSVTTIAQNIVTEAKSILKNFNLGYNMAKQVDAFYPHFVASMQKIQQMLKTTATQALQDLAPKLKVIQKSFEEIGNKEGAKAAKDLKIKLKKVAEGKAGPDTVKRAVDLLISIIDTAKVDAGQLRDILIGLGSSMGIFAGEASKMQIAAASLAQGITRDYESNLNNWTAALIKGSQAESTFGAKAGKLGAKIKTLSNNIGETTTAFQNLYNIPLGSSKAAIEKVDKAVKKTNKSGKALTNTVDRLNNGFIKTGGAGGAAASGLSAAAAAMDRLDKAAKWFAYEFPKSAQMTKDIMMELGESFGLNVSKATQASGELLSGYYDKLMSMRDLQKQMISGGPLEDEYGISDPYSAAADRYYAALEATREYYAQKYALIQQKIAEINELEARGGEERLAKEKKLQNLRVEAERIADEQIRMQAKLSADLVLSSIRTMLGQVSGIMMDLMQAGLIKSKKFFAIYKAIKVAEAIISTYAAANQALADPTIQPTFMKYVAVAIAIARGMANVAMIKAQKMPSTYHTGGYVGTQPRVGNMGGLRDDEIPAILQKGEYVLSKKDVELIKSVNLSAPEVNVAPAQTEVVIINQIDDTVMEQWAESRTGREIIQNVVRRA